ncbi:putative Flp pilus-assembly TadE/G-like protein [Haloactinopolyspora alba]|uniref:Putative Flp pilus-assembly TadE/G-like protein n=1 Tax=Haloactinopolyspora alba TaxID=648780 RepID=A0A2P8DW14_9ACTN|nr:hypothetical protein [Haloactinopolyspora alba]PSL01384.1 putative Flp pilus-assembly TadE/G-like protein [Haloactinopolyspora alba]
MSARGLRLRGDDGAIAIFAVVIVMALFLAIGLVVDGGGRLRAMQRADALAAEAARTGAQRILIGGDTDRPTIDVTPACQAASAYLVQAGVQPSGCGRVDGETLRVSATVSYDNVFLSLIGQSTSQVTGSARARLARGVDEEY